MRGLWRRLGYRFVIVSIAIGLVGVLSSHLAARLVVRESVYATFAPFARSMLDRHEIPRCEAHPESWSLTLDDGAQFFAYDKELQSRNAKAPPIRRELYDAMLRTSERIAVYPLGPFTGGVAFYRTNRGGDCALVQAIYPAPAIARRHIFDASLVGVLLVVTFSVFLGFLASIRPLAVRIRRIRLTAERVGDAEGYRSSTEEGGGELNEIAAMLDKAHARIRADADALNERQHALQRWDPFAGAPLVDLADTVQRIMSRAQVFAKRRGIAVESAFPDETVLVRANALALEQAIANVVYNSIGYNDEGGHVAVALEATKDTFTLRIAGDGPGVPATDLPLGLAITNEVCIRCGFDLELVPEEPKGLAVTFRGPRRTESKE